MYTSTPVPAAVSCCRVPRARSNRQRQGRTHCPAPASCVNTTPPKVGGPGGVSCFARRFPLPRCHDTKYPLPGPRARRLFEHAYAGSPHRRSLSTLTISAYHYQRHPASATINRSFGTQFPAPNCIASISAWPPLTELDLNTYIIPVAWFPDMDEEEGVLDEADGRSVRLFFGQVD